MKDTFPMDNAEFIKLLRVSDRPEINIAADRIEELKRQRDKALEALVVSNLCPDGNDGWNAKCSMNSDCYKCWQEDLARQQ